MAENNRIAQYAGRLLLATGLVAAGAVGAREYNKRYGNLPPITNPQPGTPEAGFAPQFTPTPEMSPTPTPDPLKNFREAQNLLDGETHTFEGLPIDVFWIDNNLGSEAIVAAATLQSEDGTKREPYVAISNGECLYRAARTTKEFGDALREPIIDDFGHKLTRIVLREPVIVSKLTGEVGRGLRYSSGRVMSATLIEDEQGDSVSCDSNNPAQIAQSIAVIEGQTMRNIPNPQTGQ